MMLMVLLLTMMVICVHTAQAAAASPKHYTNEWSELTAKLGAALADNFEVSNAIQSDPQ